MNNEQQSEQQKAIRRFFYWEFFLLHYYALPSLIYFLLQWIAAHQMRWYGYFFYTFFYRIYT